MSKTHLFYLAGFAVRARTRRKAVHKFVRIGFAAFVAEQETKQLHKENVLPFALLEGRVAA